MTTEQILTALQLKIDWMNIYTYWDNEYLDWYATAIKDMAELYWLDRDNYWIKDHRDTK